MWQNNFKNCHFHRIYCYFTIQASVETCLPLKSTQNVDKGEIMSEDIGGFLPLPKNIPKNYLKLSYPVHSNDKGLLGFDRLHVKKL